MEYSNGAELPVALIAMLPLEIPKQFASTGVIPEIAMSDTLTATEAVELQTFLEVLTVYTVVVEGLAETVAPVVAFRPVDGDQLNVLFAGIDCCR